ncbi:MAG: DUF2946 domain-containing protein [Nitrosomonadales bacterium]|nr:DUF2946 domain-containing protein [Nitrosomonadales bacterium]
MSDSFRKLVAVILAIWLPLFSGNAMAVSAVMQAQDGDCHPAVAQPGKHPAEGSSQHAHHALAATDGLPEGAGDQHDPSCDNCGVCHIACTGYLGVPAVAMELFDPGSRVVHPIAVNFVSHLSAPLDPPPLVIA